MSSNESSPKTSIHFIGHVCLLTLLHLCVRHTGFSLKTSAAMAFRWRDNQTLRFIHAYKKCPALWDKTRKDYRRWDKCEEDYQQMIKEINIPGLTPDDIKAKIKTVRTRYASELHKIEESKNAFPDEDDFFVPRIFWYKEIDSFLRPFMRIKSSKDNYCKNKPRRKKNEQPSVITKSEWICKEDNNDNEATNHQEDEETNDSQVFESAVEDPLNESTSTPANVKRKPESVDYAIETTSWKFPRYSEDDFSQPQRQQDTVMEQQTHEFDLFCNSLAVQLKKMPLERALICQEKLQSVMTRERLSMLATEQK